MQTSNTKVHLFKLKVVHFLKHSLFLNLLIYSCYSFARKRCLVKLCFSAVVGEFLIKMMVFNQIKLDKFLIICLKLCIVIFAVEILIIQFMLEIQASNNRLLY